MHVKAKDFYACKALRSWNSAPIMEASCVNAPSVIHLPLFKTVIN